MYKKVPLLPPPPAIESGLIGVVTIDEESLLELDGFRLQTSLTPVVGVFDGLRREELLVVEGVLLDEFERGGAGLRFSSGYRPIAC